MSDIADSRAEAEDAIHDLYDEARRFERENEAMWRAISTDCPQTDCPNWFTFSCQVSCAGNPSCCPRIEVQP